MTRTLRPSSRSRSSLYDDDGSSSSSSSSTNITINNNNKDGDTRLNIISKNELPIVDNIMYNGEDVVPIRIELLYEVVDRFYITESKTTHSGKPKPLYSEIHKDLFEPFRQKITWLVYEDPPNFTLAEVQGGMSGDIWRREQLQRQFALEQMKQDVESGLLASAKEFIIINSDGDEIPDPDVVKEFQPGGTWHEQVRTKPMFLEMYWLSFNANWRKNGNWTKAHTLPGSKIITGDLNFQSMRNGRLSDKSPDRIPNAGWHLTYFMSVLEIQRKLDSFAHQEFNKPRFSNSNHILDCIKNGKDLYRRTWWVEQMVPFEFLSNLPLPLQKFHQQVLAKQNITTADETTTVVAA